MSAAKDRKPYRRFESLETEIVWAAVERLDIADKHALLEVLGQELLVEPHLRLNGPATREARAVLALRETSKILGRSPSIEEYVELSQEFPECRWPHPSRVRAWLGSNSWNRALERAGLEPVPTDAIVRERLGSRFSHDDLIRALQLAAADLQCVPTFEQYNHWTRRPDVVSTHGLLPRAVQTFIVAFGSWSGACIAAGLRDSNVLVTKDGVIRYAAHEYERAEMIEALRFAAKQIGRTPTVGEHDAVRAKVQSDSTSETINTLPSTAVIKRGLDKDWAKACIAAGLDDPGPSVCAPFSDEELIEWVVRAFVEKGEISQFDYDAWRAGCKEDAAKVGEKLRIPSGVLIRRRFGGWPKARRVALERLGWEV